MSDAVHAGPTAGAGLASRERTTIIGALVGVSVVAWLYLLDLEQGMAGMSGMSGAMTMAPAPWSGTTFLLMFVMWWVMMIGMMVPSAMPMVLTFATVNRRKGAHGQPYVPTSTFVTGYLAVWGAFSLAATLAQWGLEQSAMMLPSMRISSGVLGGILFIAAGAYQWTPLKASCLRKCRTPLDFVLNHWRDGRLGALRMGIEHGTLCLGCCAVLMVLLFVGGVMNLLWVAAIAAFVLVEKLFPAGEITARVGGLAMIGMGAYLLLPG